MEKEFFDMSGLKLKLKLREDLEYSDEDLIREIASLNRVSSTFARKIVEELKEYVYRRLKPEIEYLKHVFAKLNPNLKIEVGSPNIFYKKNKQVITFGQWIGTYKIELESADIEVEITPKVGWDSTIIMLNDISKLVRMLGMPMLNLIFSNILGSSFIKQYIHYSIRLMQLTELMIARGIPPISYEKEYFVDSNLGYVGKINFGKTLNYLNHGQNLIVARKVIIGYPILPISVLVKFHYTLGNELLKQMKNLDKNIGREIIPLKMFVQQQAFYHIYITSLPPFSHYLNHAIKMDLESSDILKKAREQVSTNPWLQEIIDLYMSFLSKLSIANLEYYSKKVSIQPLPSSKIYELWILYMLLKTGREIFNIEPRMEELYNKFDLKKCKIMYNKAPTEVLPEITMPFSWWEHLRPDFSILNGGKQAVVDAKYREINKLNHDDFLRMMSYILYFSKPQGKENREIKGIFISLSNKSTSQKRFFTQKRRIYKILERSDLNPAIRIYNIEVDPRLRHINERNIEALFRLIIN